MKLAKRVLSRVSLRYNEGKRSASCGIIECLDVTYNRNEEHRERDAEL